MSDLAGSAVDATLRIPELLRRHPELRAVLDRYGLRGCGGPLGPEETLRYFARAHGVDEGDLLQELEAALAASAGSAARLSPSASAGRSPVPPAPPAYRPLPEDTIYRRFFKAGIVIVLTAGALWGAILLLGIGASQSFTKISIHDVNAHGHAQIFGWIGLFVMGFAYQAFPRFKHTSLALPSLAQASFFLMTGGIALRVVSEPFVRESPIFLYWGVLAGAMELAAIGAFVAVLAATYRRAGRPLEPYDGYVIAAVSFFALQAIGDLALFLGTSTAPTREALIATVATYQPVLRDFQIHGFALLMVLGVSHRVLPAMFGYPRVPERTSWVALALLLVAIAGEAGGWLWVRRAGASPLTVSVLWTSTVLLGSVAAVLTTRMGVLGRCPEPDRSTKFFKAAYAWLLVSMALLAATPGYLSAAGVPFSHAYGGAVRHAITVGFLSLMILGVTAKVVPTLSGVDSRKLSPLTLPFVLVNVGCAMRVGFQILTDFTPAFAFPVAGVSGLFEVAGIGLWGIETWRVMSRPPRDGETTPASVQTRPAAGEVTRADRVGPLVEAHPELLAVFLRFGFAPLRNPVFRSTLASQITVAQAAAMHGVDIPTLLEALNAARRRSSCGSAEGAIDPSATVAEILKRHPAAAAVFARHRIDACCGGAKPLSLVCEKHGLPLETILAELRQAACASPRA